MKLPFKVCQLDMEHAVELFALYSILPAGKVLPGVAALTEAA